MESLFLFCGGGALMLGNGVCCGLSVVITYGLSRIGVVRGDWNGSMLGLCMSGVF